MLNRRLNGSQTIEFDYYSSLLDMAPGGHPDDHFVDFALTHLGLRSWILSIHFGKARMVMDPTTVTKNYETAAKPFSGPLFCFPHTIQGDQLL